MREEIEAALARIETDRQVRILYACESGSRAWGFASANSDYDVRFIYAHRPDWYLSILDHRDVIEQMLPNDLDVSGWDLRKALRLFRKSNPPLIEWLSSPIVYREDEAFTLRLRKLMANYYSPSSCLAHYLHMAEGNIRNYLGGEEVRTKKYLYVIRPLLACRWIEQKRGPVPMEFEKLFVTVEDRSIIEAIHALVEQKRAGGELESGPRNPVLADFIDSEAPRIRALTRERSEMPSTELLDDFFRETIGFTEAFGSRAPAG